MQIFMDYFEIQWYNLRSILLGSKKSREYLRERGFSDWM